MDQSDTPLAAFLEQLLAGCCRVKVIPDQAKTTQAVSQTREPTKPKHKRRSMDMICRVSDVSPCRPNRRASIEMEFSNSKLSIQPPRMPTRRGSCAGCTPPAMGRPGIPRKDKAMMHLMAPPMA